MTAAQPDRLDRIEASLERTEALAEKNAVVVLKQ
jgi:hypothetical protein